MEVLQTGCYENTSGERKEIRNPNQIGMNALTDLAVKGNESLVPGGKGVLSINSGLMLS